MAPLESTATKRLAPKVTEVQSAEVSTGTGVGTHDPRRAALKMTFDAPVACPDATNEPHPKVEPFICWLTPVAWVAQV